MVRSPIRWRSTELAKSSGGCWSNPFSTPCGLALTLVIVPDGALHGLNFETLPASGTPRRFDRGCGGSDRSVAGTPRTPPVKRSVRSLLVVGNPTPRNPDFPVLRYASAEMSSIARHFGGGSSRTYQGEQASPRELFEARVRSSSRSSTSPLTRPRTVKVRSIQRSSSRGPMMPTSSTRETWRISPLRAELVTVSACRSAGEAGVPERGLVGFAWAFLRAGARRGRGTVGRRRSLDRRPDGRDVHAAGCRRHPAASAARGQARADGARRRRGQAVLLGTVPGIYGFS